MGPELVFFIWAWNEFLWACSALKDTPSFFSSFGSALGDFFPLHQYRSTLCEACILVFKDMLETRLQAWTTREWTGQGLLRPRALGCSSPNWPAKMWMRILFIPKPLLPALCWAAGPLVVPAASLQQVLALGHVVSWWRDKRKHMFIKLVLFPLFSFSHRVSWVLHFLWALLSSLYNAVTRGYECPCSYSRVNNWSLNCVFWTREMTFSSWKSQLRRHGHINANTGTYSHAHITEFCKIKW